MRRPIGLPICGRCSLPATWRTSLAEPLTQQLGECRVTQAAGGQLSLMAGSRSDVIRATAWALHTLEHDPPKVPMIF